MNVFQSNYQDDGTSALVLGLITILWVIGLLLAVSNTCLSCSAMLGAIDLSSESSESSDAFEHLADRCAAHHQALARGEKPARLNDDRHLPPPSPLAPSRSSLPADHENEPHQDAEHLDDVDAIRYSLSGLVHRCRSDRAFLQAWIAVEGVRDAELTAAYCAPRHLVACTCQTITVFVALYVCLSTFVSYLSDRPFLFSLYHCCCCRHRRRPRRWQQKSR